MANRSSTKKTKRFIWTASADEYLLLSMVEKLKEKKCTVPWDDIAKTISPTIEGKTIRLHLAKLRKSRLDKGEIIPPGPYSEEVASKGDHTNTVTSNGRSAARTTKVNNPQRRKARKPIKIRDEKSTDDDSEGEYLPLKLKSKKIRQSKNILKSKSRQHSLTEEEDCAFLGHVAPQEQSKPKNCEIYGETPKEPQKMVRLKLSPTTTTSVREQSPTCTRSHDTFSSNQGVIMEDCNSDPLSQTLLNQCDDKGGAEVKPNSTEFTNVVTLESHPNYYQPCMSLPIEHSWHTFSDEFTNMNDEDNVPNEFNMDSNANEYNIGDSIPPYDLMLANNPNDPDLDNSMMNPNWLHYEYDVYADGMEWLQGADFD